jgi:hypothetical protein
MKLARLALLTLCLVTAVARGESSSTAWKPAPPHRWRKTGIGLMVAGGTCLVLGAVFTGLAAQANSDALADMKYHPSSEDARTSYQITAGALYLVGGAALVAGVVLLW